MVRFIIQVRDPGYIKGRKPNPYFIQVGEPTYPFAATDSLSFAASFGEAREAVEYLAKLAQYRGERKDDKPSLWHGINKRYQFSLLRVNDERDDLQEWASITFVEEGNTKPMPATISERRVYSNGRADGDRRIDYPSSAGYINLDIQKSPRNLGKKEHYQTIIHLQAAATPKSRVKEMLATASVSAADREAARQAALREAISQGNYLVGSL